MYTSDKLLIVSFYVCTGFIHDLCPSFYTHFLPFSCLITFTYIPSKHSVIFFSSSSFRHYISHFVCPISSLYTCIYIYTHSNIHSFIHFVYVHTIISPIDNSHYYYQSRSDDSSLSDSYYSIKIVYYFTG